MAERHRGTDLPSGRHLARTLERIVRALLSPLLPATLAVHRELADAEFVRAQRLTPTVGSRLLGAPVAVAARIRRQTAADYRDGVLAKYVRRLTIHYGPGGRGYSPVSAASHAERQARYDSQTSRLAYFTEEFGDLIHLVDGDSFLDLGCGTGQNIRMLAATFPHSRIHGVDVNSDAVRLVEECEPSSLVSVETGSLKDPGFLTGVLASGYDHIVLSHVLSLLFESSAESTRLARQRLIDMLVQSCSKSVIIVDRFGERGQFAVVVEQVNRATVVDDVLSYFDSCSSGRAVLVNSPSSQAILFIKSTPGN